VLAVTGGIVTLASAAGRRDVAAADFFVGPLESAVGPGELAVEAFFPAAPPGAGTAFVEVARRHGDYAMCGVAAVVAPPAAPLDGASPGSPSVRVAYVSMGPTPAVVDLTGAGPAGPGDDPRSWQEAAARAVAQLDPEGDVHASAGYRRHLGRVLTARALAAAWAASGGAAQGRAA